MMSKNSIVPFLKDYLIKFLTRPFLLDTNGPELKGFLILLKCKCLNGTNTSKFSQDRLAKELNLSTGSISKYMKLAIDNGYIKKDEKGIHLLREDIFLITAETPNTYLQEHFPKTKPPIKKQDYCFILD